MPVRLRYKFEISISSTSAEEKDLGNVKWEVVTDKLGEGGMWKTLLAAGATDVQIPLDSISEVNFLALKTVTRDPNQTLTPVLIRKNSNTGEQLSVEPVGDCRQGQMAIATSGVTALFASNLGTADIELIVIAAGD